MTNFLGRAAFESKEKRADENANADAASQLPTGTGIPCENISKETPTVAKPSQPTSTQPSLSNYAEAQHFPGSKK